MVENKRWWIIATFCWLIAIYFFTELPYFNGESTSAVIKKTIDTTSETTATPTTHILSINALNLLFRKSAHIIVFGILAVLLFKSFKRYKFSYLIAWMLTFIYAMTDEWHQSYIPGRVASFRDVLFDSFGAVVGLTLIFLFLKMKRSRHS